MIYVARMLNGDGVKFETESTVTEIEETINNGINLVDEKSGRLVISKYIAWIEERSE